VRCRNPLAKGARAYLNEEIVIKLSLEEVCQRRGPPFDEE